MKKVLSIALVLCMLLAVMAPLSVSAWEYEPGDITNTSEIFTGTSNTGLGAYRGTPTLNETTGSLKDSAWNNAISLPLNRTTKPLITNASFGDDVNAEFYFLWDDTYLYILEEYKNTAIGEKNKDLSSIGENFENWRSTHTSTLYNIMLPSDTKLSGVMVTAMPNGNVTWDADAKTGSILDGLVRVRYYSVDISYQGTSNPGKTKVSTTDSRLDVATRTQKTETGFMQETKVSWNTLKSLSGVSFTPADAAKIGIKISAKPADGVSQRQYHVNHAGNDYLGYDSMSLLTTKPTRTNAAAAIVPDTAYWTNNISSATEFEIGTPERLLGLAYYLCSVDTDKKTDGTNITSGKTFKLTADIDLNPGQDWTKVGTASLGYWEGPQTVWPTLDGFAGSFDGQGHMISGLYCLGVTPVSRNYTGEYGFIARWLEGGDVKNIIFDNGYMITTGTASIGVVAGLRSYNATTDTSSSIVNVYIGENMTISAAGKAANLGCLIGGSWENTTNCTLKIENVVFDGTIIPGTGNNGVLFGHLQKHQVTVSDFVYRPTNATAPTKYVAYYQNSGTLNGAENNDAAKTRCYIITDANGAAAALAEAPGYMVETTKGVMPVKLADMMAKYKWQSTEADNDGKYSIRIIGEVASLAYDAVGFKVRLYKNGAAATEIKENVANTAVYGAVKAAGSEFDASTFNTGFMDGVDNKLFVITLDGLTDADVWKIEVTAVYTMDGKPIESAVAKTVTVSAYNPAT